VPGVQTLTREEATERARIVAPPGGRAAVRTAVRLDLTADACADAERFLSTTTLSFACTEPGSSTFVDLDAAAVRSVRLNGRELATGEHVDGARIRLTGLAAENELTVVAECRYMHTGEGLHRFADPVDGRIYTYTQFETADAHRVYACFDQPDIKTTFELDVDAPADWHVVTVTPADRRPATVSDVPQASSAHWHFAESRPLSTYVTAVIAGAYHVVNDVHHGRAADIPLGIYCRRSLAEHLDADEIFAVTKQGFAFFEKEFAAPYPFEKYDQLFVPEFNAGAMENAGAVTFLEDYLFRSRVTDTAYEGRATTILHEMAHMWFGDLVTMRWWDDLWLNESFATYMATLAQAEATRWRDAWTTFANEEKTWAYRQDQLSTTHPIAADIPDVEAVETNFDGITYAKGAAVLKQLVAWVGREPFFTALRTYFDVHAWGNTTLEDLLTALEESSGRDLGDWSKQWLESAGANTLRPDLRTDDAGRIAEFAVVQEAPEEHPTLRSHRVAIGCYSKGLGGLAGLERTHRVEVDVVGSRTPVDALSGIAQPDLILINDDDLTYAKVRLDPRSLATVTESVGEIRDSLPRALCWAAAWDMTRDAEMATRDYARMVIHLLDTESDVGVLQTVLRQARLALERWADPVFRPTGLDMLAAATHAHLHSAAPGSDHQLAFLRGFAAAANSAPYLDTLHAIFVGDITVPGLPLDTDLRWTLLARLAAHGRVGVADIDAELARDDTATGRRHALSARAALPDAAEKERAWQLVVERHDTHNAEISAILAGFQQASQLELLMPYAGRYFDVVGDVWRERTGDTARTIADGLFPYLVIEEGTIERVSGYLSSDDPPPGLRRIVLEHRDALVRALRARARDAAAGSDAGAS
jgi:aminopeptidase N